MSIGEIVIKLNYIKIFHSKVHILRRKKNRN